MANNQLEIMLGGEAEPVKSPTKGNEFTIEDMANSSTGQLETTPIPTHAPIYTPEGLEVPYISTYSNMAKKYNVPLSTVLAVSHAETGGTFNPKATSPTGVIGLMQTTKQTTKDMGLDPSLRHVPEVSIEAGVKYLRRLIDERKIDPNDAFNLMMAYTTPEGGYTKAYGKKVQDLIKHYGGSETSEVAKKPSPAEQTIIGAQLNMIAGAGLNELGGIDTVAGEVARPTARDLLAQQARGFVGTGELALNLASSMLLYFPSKIAGVMALPWGREAANIAEKEMSELGYQPRTREGKWAAEMIGKGFELFLTPAKSIDIEVSKLSPEAGYLVGLGTELAEFYLTGGIAKGTKAKLKLTIDEAKGVIDKKADMESKAIDNGLTETEGIKDEAVKSAQQRILELEKAQADARRAEALKKFDEGADQLIKDELGRKNEEVARARTYKDEETSMMVQRPEGEPEATYTSKKGRRYEKVDGKWYDEGGKEVKNKFVINAAEKRAKTVEKPVEPAEVISINDRQLDKKLESEGGVSYGEADYIEGGKVYDKYGRQIETVEEATRRLDIEESKMNELDGKILAKDIEDPHNGKVVFKKGRRLSFDDVDKLRRLGIDLDYLLSNTHKVKLEVVTDLDLQTGTPEPVQLKGENSPFFQSREVTDQRTEIFKDRKLDNVESITMKLVNDVNRWYHGDDSVDIGELRNMLSEVAARADELRMRFEKESDHQVWKETVSEAAVWARSLERGGEGGGVGGGVQLNMMIPLNEVPKAVKDVIRGSKNLFRRIIGDKINTSNLYRNKEIYNKTGFWLGRDGRWRYEIDDSRIEYEPTYETRHEYYTGELAITSLVDVVKNKEIYDAVPELRDVVVIYDPFYKHEGTTGKIDGNRTIVIKRLGDKDTFLHELQHVVNDITGAFEGSSSETQKGLGKGEDAFSSYQKVPGEMESRLVEKRLGMSAKERRTTPPWETLDKMLNEEGYAGSGTKLYDIGGATAEGVKRLIKGAGDFARYLGESRAYKRFKPGTALRMIREELNRSAVDKSGNIRLRLLDELGDEGYNIIQKMYLSRGASSLAAKNLKQMQKEVYRGLSKQEREILDGIILADRMADIAKYKKGFKFPEYVSSDGKVPDKSITWRETFKDIYKLTDKKAADLEARAKAYFDWMKKPLDDMLMAELITPDEYKALVLHNYRRIKLVDIYDRRYQSKVGIKRKTVYDSGIEALSRGRTTDIYEPSSEIMALEVFNRAYGRILNNEANMALLDLAERDPNNPFVRVKDKEHKIPSGWNRVFVYKGGERKAMYLSPEMSKEWITSNPEMSYRLSQFIRLVSGSPILRTFATGINWGFALANLPRDVMHIWFASRIFENGKWKHVYSPHAPIYTLQMGRDLATVFSDAVLRKGRYNDYINEGGGMEFLVHQGRILKRGRHLEGNIDKINNILGYFGETSEILTRLAIRERVIRKGKSPTEATFAARDYMDFGQGGGIAKALDNGMPYLNAAIQGTRGLFRSFRDNPMVSTYKLSQLAALTAGIYIAMKSMSPETEKNLRGDMNMTNNLCIPLGDQFGFLDDKGQMRYLYIKIPLDPGQRFFKKFFEASTDKWMGNEVDASGTASALKELSPVSDISGIIPPTISSVLGYMTNKDFWRNKDIWNQSEPFSWPMSKEEYTSKTPEAFIGAGKVTGLSPERLKYSVSELVTNGTIYSYLLGQGYNAAFGSLPKEKKEQHLAMTLSKMPAIGRFIGVTNPYSKHAEKIDKAQEAAVLRRFVENRNFDIKAEAYLYGEGISMRDLEKEANQYKDADTYDRLMERLEFERGIKNLPEKSFWRRMKGLSTEAKAKVFVDRLKSSNNEERNELWKEVSIVHAAGGVISDKFFDEVDSQYSGK